MTALTPYFWQVSSWAWVFTVQTWMSWPLAAIAAAVLGLSSRSSMPGPRIQSRPITGASIDLFNDPTDSASEGWAKRMGLGVAEIGAGAAMMGTGNPLGMVAGAGRELDS